MKKMLFIIFVISFIYSVPEIEWSQTFGGFGYDASFSSQQTSDGGYIVVGSTDSSAVLLKTSSIGTTEWHQHFGGSGQSGQQTSDGGYIITGDWQNDILLIKTDSNGIEEWNQTFGLASIDKGYSVQQTSDGGYIVGGRASGNAFLIKTDSNGNEEWSQIYNGFGSIYDNISINSVKQTSQGSYIFVGNGMHVNDLSYQSFLAEVEANGNVIWYNQVSYSQNYSTGDLKDVEQTSDGGYIVIGDFREAWSPNDILLLKTDQNGSEEWLQTFGGDEEDYGYSVQQTSDGGYIATGFKGNPFGNDGWLTKLDSDGNDEWSKSFGEGEQGYGYSVQQTSDGGYVISGGTLMPFGEPSSQDILLIKIEPEVYDCIDSEAENYNPDANVDDGSCEYEPYFDCLSGFNNPMGISISDAEIDGTNLEIWDEIAVFDGDVCVGSYRVLDNSNSPYSIIVPEDDPNTDEIDGFTSGNPMTFKMWDHSQHIELFNVDVEFYESGTVDTEFTPLGNSLLSLYVDAIYGCVDESACNYSENNTVNDNSCWYYEDNGWCNCYGNVDLGCGCANPAPSGCDEQCGSTLEFDECGVCDGDNSSCGGCIDETALNYDPYATLDDGTCEYPSIGDINADNAIDVLDIVLIVNWIFNDDPYAFYADTNNDGAVNVVDIVVIVNWIINPISGCTDDSACNYSSEATQDDGSCEYDGYNEDGYYCGDLNVISNIIAINSSISNFDIYFTGGDWSISQIWENGRLIELTIYEKGLIALPENIGNLSYLQSLNLRHNEISIIPDSFGNLNSLVELELSENPVGFLPESFSDLTNLQAIYMYGTQLTSLPEDIGNLTNLTYISFGGNMITSLPSSFTNLINLEQLYINDDNNQLTSLPEDIGNLTSLTSLHLNGNELTSLPSSIWNLTNLESFRLDDNQLTSISDDIINLTNLGYINLSRNQLTSIPEIICNLPSLYQINLGGNLLCDEYNFECEINEWYWDNNGAEPQDQSNCP